MEDLSIIIPVAGRGYEHRLGAVLWSMRRQTAHVEIIVAEMLMQRRPVYERLAKKMGAKYVKCSSDKLGLTRLYVPGRIRNVGAAAATASLLYFTDADIVATDEQFAVMLGSLASGNDHVAYVKPPVTRLLKYRVREFCRLLVGDRMEELPRGFGARDLVVDLKGNRLHRIAGSPKVAIHNDEQYLVYGVPGGPREPLSPNAIPWSGLRHVRYRPVVHYGGLLCWTSDFWRVGGYCERYIRWGFEDEDLFWKLALVADVRRFHFENPLPRKLVHLDHGRGSFCSLLYERNLFLHELRRLQGRRAAVEHDLNRLTSFAAARIAGDTGREDRIRTDGFRVKGVSPVDTPLVEHTDKVQAEK